MLSNNNITANTVTGNIPQPNTPQPNSSSISSSASNSPHGVSGSPQTGGATPYGLDKGQVVKGEVIDLKNNEVSVKLEDGQIIKGKLAAEGTDLSIGSKVTFRVEDISSQSLTLKIIPSDSSVYLESTIDKALEAANLSKTDKNKSLVAELLNANMSIDKNTLMNLSKQILQFPGSSIKALVFLNRNNLPVNSTNTAFMDSFLNSDGKVLSELTSLSETINSVLQGGGDTTAKYKLLSVLLPSLSVTENTEGSQTASMLSGILNTEERSALYESIKNSSFYAFGSQDMEGILTGTVSLPETLNLLNGNSGLLTGSRLSPDISALPPGESGSPLAEGLQSKLSDLEPAIIQKLLAAAEDAVKETLNIPDNTGKVLTPEERLQFLNLLKDNLPGNALPDSITHGLVQGNISSEELLTVLKPFLSEASGLPESNTEKIISSKEFNRLLSSSLLSQWSLSPEDLAKPSSISTHYESLLKQLNDIRELAENTSFKDMPALQSQASHVTDTVNFMNTLNQLFTYLQLPVKLKNQYSDSELHIYSNKKSELDIMEGVRVVLHLKMDHLGPVDVAVELKQNQLKNSFYLENKNVMELLSSHMEVLEEKLKSKGYQVKTEFYDRKKEESSPAGLMKEQLLSSLNRNPSIHPMEKKRYHFDIRA